MKLSEITTGISLTGLEAQRVCAVIATTPCGDAAPQAVCLISVGTIRERLLGPVDKGIMSLGDMERPWTFDELSAEVQESREEKMVDDATAATSTVESEPAIVILTDLELRAKVVVASSREREHHEPAVQSQRMAPIGAWWQSGPHPDRRSLSLDCHVTIEPSETRCF